MAIDFSSTILLQNKLLFYLLIDFNNEDDLVMLQNIINRINEKCINN